MRRLKRVANMKQLNDEEDDWKSIIKSLSNMELSSRTLRGLLFCFLWYACILWSVYFIYMPLVLLLLINRKWFRKCADIILSCWEMYPACLLEILIGTKMYMSGDSINPNDGAIIIMNHRNRLDWFFLWAALLHGTKPPAHRCKFVLKSSVRNIPGIGWGLQLAGFLFIHRNWESDKKLLERSLDYFRDLGEKYQILIFPEGTNLSPSTQERSNAFADKNMLKRYDYVLHPRTTGFEFLVSHMKKNSQIDAIYDLTVGYPKTLPTTETDIVKGMIPEEVHFHIKRHDISTLPSDETGIKSWCENRWAEKESTLKTFYETNDSGGGGDMSSDQTEKKRRFFDSNAICDRPWNAMYLALVAWTVVTFYFIYISFTNIFAFYWMIFCTIAFALYSYFTDGIQQFEINLYNEFDKPKIIRAPETNGRVHHDQMSTTKITNTAQVSNEEKKIL